MSLFSAFVAPPVEVPQAAPTLIGLARADLARLQAELDAVTKRRHALKAESDDLSAKYKDAGSDAARKRVDTQGQKVREAFLEAERVDASLRQQIQIAQARLALLERERTYLERDLAQVAGAFGRWAPHVAQIRAAQQMLAELAQLLHTCDPGVLNRTEQAITTVRSDLAQLLAPLAPLEAYRKRLAELGGEEE